MDVIFESSLEWVLCLAFGASVFMSLSIGMSALMVAFSFRKRCNCVTTLPDKSGCPLGASSMEGRGEEH